MRKSLQSSIRSALSSDLRDFLPVRHPHSPCSNANTRSLAVVANWAPEFHAYSAQRLSELHARDPSLKRNFPSSIFAATTYNLGPRTVCFKHKDFANLSFGWCAVTALGTFDYKKGSHLILWDCHLVIEFLPGCTILLPSAILTHSNVEISPEERRYSFTQYNADGLFRWVENGFQKSPDFYASLSEEGLKEQQLKDAARWEFGLSMFPSASS